MATPPRSDQAAQKSAAGDAAVLLVVLLLVLATMVTVGWIARRSMASAVVTDRWAAHTQFVINEQLGLVSALKDAETGERGFIITGNKRYLEPYRSSLQRIAAHLTALRLLTAGDSRQQGFLSDLIPLIAAELADLKEGVALRESRGLPAAKALVETNEGKNIMDGIRALLNRARKENDQSLRERMVLKASDYRHTINSVFLGGVLSGLALLLLCGYLRLELVRRVRSEEELREHRDRLARRTDQLTEANAELDAFSSSVAHDLRAPIRQILGFARLLTEDYGAALDDEARRRLGKIEAGARLMGRLVDDLLTLSKVTRQALGPEVVPLSPIAADVVEELKREAAGRDVEWKIGELFEVKCDPSLTRQVFTNLLSNALKYTRRRERAVIEVGATTTEAGERAVFVRDNGVGFDLRYAGKLFGIFQRLHSTSEFEGTGVGLATADRIVRKHGGRIWAQSEPDRGATFYFTLEPSAAPKGEL